jgi:hypothetical protein
MIIKIFLIYFFKIMKINVKLILIYRDKDFSTIK